MLFLLSISVTLVGAAILLAFILFSHSDEREDERGGGLERREYEGRSGWGDEPPSPYRPPGPPSGVAAPTRVGREGAGPRTANANTPGRGAAGDASGIDLPGGADRHGDKAGGGQGEPADRKGAASSIPIMRPDTPIPGLGRLELVHFMGKAGFGVLEDERELGEVRIEGDGPTLELEGEIALTSKQIIVFDGKTAKKIPFGFMEAYRFVDSFLLIKRRNVKKKKTLLKIFGNVSDFQYILNALIPL